MLRKLLIVVLAFCCTQFVTADIPTDIGNGVKPRPATETAKTDDVTPQDAVVQLIQAGVDCVVAVVTVSNVYGLSPLEKDSIISEALNVAVPPCENTTPLAALYSTGTGLRLAVGSDSRRGIGDIGSSGGGTLETPVSPN